MASKKKACRSSKLFFTIVPRKPVEVFGLVDVPFVFEAGAKRRGFEAVGFDDFFLAGNRIADSKVSIFCVADNGRDRGPGRPSVFLRRFEECQEDSCGEIVTDGVEFS